VQKEKKTVTSEKENNNTLLKERKNKSEVPLTGVLALHSL
jgi:hypothetical protein